LQGGDDKLSAAFGSYPLNSLIRSYAGTFGPSVGSCNAFEVIGSSLVLVDPVQPQYLNAGPQLTINGPGGVKTEAAASTGLYSATLSSAAPFYVAPGNYTVQNGSGGTNVAAFNWSLTLPPSLIPTNLPAHVNRAQDLTLTWSGGSGFSVATIFIYAGVPVTSSTNSYAELICNAQASAGQFTVPSAILNLLPTNGYGSEGVPGVNIQIAGVPLVTFSGTSGIDAGLFSAFITSGAVVGIQ